MTEESKAPDIMADGLKRNLRPTDQSSGDDARGTYGEEEVEQLAAAATESLRLRAGYARLLVEEEGEVHGESAGGIIVPNQSGGGIRRGKVISVGPLDEKYHGQSCRIEEGDTVLYASRVPPPPGAGAGVKGNALTIPLTSGGRTYVVVFQAEVLGVEVNEAKEREVTRRAAARRASRLRKQAEARI